MTMLASLPVPLALLDMLGGSELLVIFLLVLVFFGGEKMPEFARGLGKAIREFRKAASGVEQEFKRALEEDPNAPRPPPPAYTSPNTILPPRQPGEPPLFAPAPAPASTPVSPTPAGAQSASATPPPATPSAPPADERHPDLPEDYHAG